MGGYNKCKSKIYDNNVKNVGIGEKEIFGFIQSSILFESRS